MAHFNRGFLLQNELEDFYELSPKSGYKQVVYAPSPLSEFPFNIPETLRASQPLCIHEKPTWLPLLVIPLTPGFPVPNVLGFAGAAKPYQTTVEPVALKPWFETGPKLPKALLSHLFSCGRFVLPPAPYQAGPRAFTLGKVQKKVLGSRGPLKWSGFP